MVIIRCCGVVPTLFQCGMWKWNALNNLTCTDQRWWTAGFFLLLNRRSLMCDDLLLTVHVQMFRQMHSKCLLLLTDVEIYLTENFLQFYNSIKWFERSQRKCNMMKWWKYVSLCLFVHAFLHSHINFLSFARLIVRFLTPHHTEPIQHSNINLFLNGFGIASMCEFFYNNSNSITANGDTFLWLLAMVWFVCAWLEDKSVLKYVHRPFESANQLATAPVCSWKFTVLNINNQKCFHTPRHRMWSFHFALCAVHIRSESYSISRAISSVQTWLRINFKWNALLKKRRRSIRGYFTFVSQITANELWLEAIPF